eukprot:3173743-Pyramimonas_sp.AAC.1
MEALRRTVHCLEGLLHHVYRVGFAPVGAHHSLSFTLDKLNATPSVKDRVFCTCIGHTGATSTVNYTA